ncbi:ABC transporter family protein [Tanacetum coccineum]
MSSIFYIKKQKEPGKSKEVVYSNLKIVQIIKTYWELGHEHKFIREIIARRENSSIVSITKSDYKNLNKNDIEDLYLLTVNGKVDDYAKTGLLWSLSVFIKSTVIWERVHDFQLVVGPSGSRKTSLLRTIAGLWHTGKGKITFYAKYTSVQDLPRTPDVAPHEAKMVVEKNNLDKISKYQDFKGVFFLPKRPYIVLGTPWQQLLYPTWPDVLESTPHNSKATVAGVGLMVQVVDGMFVCFCKQEEAGGRAGWRRFLVGFYALAQLGVK